MKLSIDQDDMTAFFVDRTGRADPSRDNREGMRVVIGSLEIEFEDERDAVRLAQRILTRMGIDPGQ